jgi:hypothetical protein
MAFITKKLFVNNQEKKTEDISTPPQKIEDKPIEPTPGPDENRLTQQELVFLLECIKKSTFLGEHIELIYTTTTKLQNQYLDITKRDI